MQTLTPCNVFLLNLSIGIATKTADGDTTLVKWLVIQARYAGTSRTSALSLFLLNFGHPLFSCSVFRFLSANLKLFPRCLSVDFSLSIVGIKLP